MIFYSGFGFTDESKLFDFLTPDQFTIAGFSMGAIKAYEEAFATQKRVENLVLISPAFFEIKDEKFKKLQLISYKKDRDRYLENFYKSCGLTADQGIYKNTTNYDDLEFLLNYKWDKNRLKKLSDQGTKITIYLGGKDSIIDSHKALEFFKDFGYVYFYKNHNHLIKEIK